MFWIGIFSNKFNRSSWQSPLKYSYDLGHFPGLKIVIYMTMEWEKKHGKADDDNLKSKLYKLFRKKSEGCFKRMQFQW